MAEFKVLWRRAVSEQAHATGLTRAKAGSPEHQERLEHLAAVDSVVLEILEDHIDKVQLKLETRKGGRWQLLHLIYDDTILIIPWPTVRENLQVKVKAQMKTISFSIWTDYFKGDKTGEHYLGVQTYPIKDFLSGKKKLDLNFPHETWQVPESSFRHARDYQHLKPGAQPIRISLTIIGDRPKELCSANWWRFDLSQDSAEQIHQRLVESIPKYIELAAKEADRAHLSRLIETATQQTGSMFSEEWIRKDRTFVGAFGGRNKWSWQIQGNHLVLFWGYGGVPKGLDGTNRPYQPHLVFEIVDPDVPTLKLVAHRAYRLRFGDPLIEELNPDILAEFSYTEN